VWLLRAPATTDNRRAESPVDSALPSLSLGEACEHGEVSVQLRSQAVPLWRQDNAVD
jgi:hypothetical protein